MQFGFQMFPRGIGMTPDGIAALAGKAESLGLDHIAVSDHLLVPKGIESTYPYSEDGSWPGAAIGECGEQLTVMSYLASLTSRIRLLSSVMVVPHRQALLTAKILSTIDNLSEGRLTVGVGAGWMAEEFAAIPTPPYAERGRVTDDFIQAYKSLWTEDDPTSDSPHARFASVDFEPKPVQRPHPPVWVGGESAPAMRRAVRLGDAWYPASNNPKFRMNTPARFGERLKRLTEIAEEEGRDPKSLGLAFFAIEAVDPEPKKTDEGSRRIFSGTPDDIAGDIKAFAEHGVEAFTVVFQTPDLSSTLDRMAWFADEVLPLARA